MVDKNVLKARLEHSEGYREKAYRDTVGKLSIGIGRNLDDKGLRRSEIMFMLDNDIAEVEEELDRGLPWWRTLDPARQLVVADMCFNLGLPRLLGFKNTLAMIKAGEYESASVGMLNSLWARQVKGRANELSEIMRTGNIPQDGPPD